MIQFAYTILYVLDVSKSIEFYEKAFGLHRKLLAPDNSYAELMTGETVLAFASHQLAKANHKGGFTKSKQTNKPFGIEIGFATKNVEDALKAALAAGAGLSEEPTVKPWGQTVAYVRDPDGFLIEICTPVS